MKLNRIKVFIIAVVMLPLSAIVLFNTTPLGTSVKADTATADTYKAKCAMCHSPKAEKDFDPAKADADLVKIILEGKKDAKPPMPAFAAKGITEDQAKALVAYMKDLRKPAAGTTAGITPNPDIEKAYKAKCAMCHGQKSEKSFDTAKKDEELVEIVLKGKKGTKPPYMPAFGEKGMKNDEALGLVGYMRGLRKAETK